MTLTSTVAKSNLKEERVDLTILQVTEVNQGRNLKQKTWEPLLAASFTMGLFSVSFPNQDHLPREGAHTMGQAPFLYQLIIKTVTHRHAHTPVWCGKLHN